VDWREGGLMMVEHGGDGHGQVGRIVIPDTRHVSNQRMPNAERVPSVT